MPPSDVYEVQDSQALTEVADRARRIETRLTQTMIFLGVPLATQKPDFHQHANNKRRATLHLRSRNTTINEALGAIPPNWAGEVRVMIGSEHVTTLVVPDR